MKKFIVIVIIVLLLIAAFIFRNNIFSLFSSNVELNEEDVPEGILLNEEEVELSKAINNIIEEKEKTIIVENKTSKEIVESVDVEEPIDPLKAYDEYMASALNVSVEEAANERMIDGLKIAMCTIDDTLDVTNFDIYTQIALFYFVHVDGHIVDVYKTCKTEEDVKNYLISKDGMGKLKFSTIINEHKFVR